MADLGAIGTYKDGGLNYKAGTSISGNVLDSTGAPVRRRVLCFQESATDPANNGQYEKTAYSDPTTGVFTMPIGDTNPRTLMVGGESGKNNLVYAGVQPV